MANKKLIDILPPKKSAGIIPEKKIIKEVQLKPVSKRASFGFKPKIKNKKVYLGLLLFFVFLVFLICLRLPKADINIWPEMENFYSEEELILGKEETNLLEKEKFLTETFKSSGKVLKEEKAEGMIIIYNEYSDSPQILVETTRFVSSDGKVFRAPTRVTVPGGTYQGGRLIPGEIEVKIVADQPGPEYNIPPTTFSIPGFAGTDRYTKFYGKSSESIKGGLISEIAKILEDDLKTAENLLIKKLESGCLDLIEQELKQTEKFIYNLEETKFEIDNKSFSVEAGEEKEEFSFQAKANCELLVFEKNYLKNYSEKLILENILEEKTFVEESLKTSYSLNKIDAENNKIELSLEVSVDIYSIIEIERLKNSLTGKTLTEAKFVLENQPQIAKTNLNFWPFWVKRTPQNTDKINISLKFD